MRSIPKKYKMYLDTPNFNFVDEYSFITRMGIKILNNSTLHHFMNMMNYCKVFKDEFKDDTIILIAVFKRNFIIRDVHMNNLWDITNMNNIYSEKRYSDE